jgi:hypothetical protein
MNEMASAEPVPSDTDVHGFNVLEAAVAVITRPASAMREITAARPWLAGLLLYVAANVLNVLASMAARPTDIISSAEWALPLLLPPELEGALAMRQSPLTWVVFRVVLSLVMLVSTAGVFYLVGRLLSGRGTFGGLLATQGFASVPNFLLAPVAAMLNLAGWPLALLNWPLGVAFGVWTLVLGVIGIRESLGFSTGRAVATVLIPVPILLALTLPMWVVFIESLDGIFGATIDL